MTLRDCSESVEEGEKWTKEKLRDVQEIASPHQGQHDCAERSSKSVHEREMARTCFIYLWIVRLLTRISNLSSSLRIRSVPHSRFFAAISLIKLIVSSESLGFLEGTVNLVTSMKYIDELESEKILKAKKGVEICMVMRPV